MLNGDWSYHLGIPVLVKASGHLDALGGGGPERRRRRTWARLLLAVRRLRQRWGLAARRAAARWGAEVRP